MTIEFWVISEMNEINKINFSAQTKLRLSEIIKIIIIKRLIKGNHAVK